MKVKYLVAPLLVGAAMVVAPAMAKDLKIGAINVARLVAQSPQAAAARADMEKRFAGRRAELQALEKALRADGERLHRDAEVMSKEARDALANSIREQERKLVAAQDEYNNNVQQAQQDALESLRKDIGDVVNRYATEHDYDLILGTGVVYAKDSIDITDEVLALLK